MSHELSENLSSQEWYDTARAKAQSFLRGMDPDMNVEVEERHIIPGGKEEYDTVTLHFVHRTNSKLQWTMEIKPDFDYIENRLEDVIRRIYLEKRGEL